jgi:Rrf2 family protein
MNTHFAVAVHTLTLLAFSEGESLTSVQMAGSVNTNPVFLQRILRSLQKARLVQIQRGANGGNLLSRSPEKITLYEVYKAISQDETLFKMHNIPNPDCEVGGNIQVALQGVFGELEKATEIILDKITLADILATVKQEQIRKTNL